VARRRSTQGFGFDPEESPYHFAVIVPRGDAVGPVVIEERDAHVAADGEDQPRRATPKAYVDPYRWELIAGTARSEFNRRLRQDGLRTADWKTGETLLAPYFGKELTLLAWVVEDADPTVIPNMRANWLGFAREERWWLYTTVNAAGGHPEQGRDKGWRKAIKIAFADNPISAPALSLLPALDQLQQRPGWMNRVAEAGGRPSRRKAVEVEADQPSLFELPEGQT
jgi:hypothetical protein